MVLSRSIVPRLARSLATSAGCRKDLVKELYLNELKAYKAPVMAADAHEAHVKAYKQPPKPSAPSLVSELAAALQAYDAQEPTYVSGTGSEFVDREKIFLEELKKPEEPLGKH